MLDFMKKFFETMARAGDIIGPIEDFFVLLKLYHVDASGNKVPNPKAAPRWAKKKEHVDTWLLVTNQLTPGEQTEILQELFPKLHEAQQDDCIITTHSLATCVALPAGTTFVGFNETVKKWKRIAAIKGANDNHTHQLRVKELDSLGFLKDPATEYLLVWFETQAGRQFTDPNSFTQWAKTEGAKLVKKNIDRINNAVGKPTDPAAGTAATGLVASTVNWTSRARAWSDAAKK